LGLSETQINEADYIEARDAHSEWEFGFTINKKTGSKKLIEDIAKSTKCFPKFKNDGTFGFNTIKDSYTVIGEDSDYNTATEIKESEVIKYSFKKTKPEQIYKKVDVQYKKDYAQDSFLKRTDTIGDNTDSYYGISEDEAILEFESPYIRHDETADNLRDFIEAQYRNNHLIFNLKLPLQYIELEIGDLVKFRDLFNGVKAYGIDYRAIDEPNGQVYYPLFMVTSTKKNLDSVEIECMQLHHLSGSVEGDIDTNTGWYDWNEGGLFYFPDATPSISEDTGYEPPFIPTAPVISPIADLQETSESPTFGFTLPIATAIDGDEAQTDISEHITISLNGESYSNTGELVVVGQGSHIATYSVISPTSVLSSSITVNISLAGNSPPYFDATLNTSSQLLLPNNLGQQSYPPQVLSQIQTNDLSDAYIHFIPKEGNQNNWSMQGDDYYERYVYETATISRDISLSGQDIDGNISNVDSQTHYGWGALLYLSNNEIISGEDFNAWGQRLVNMGEISVGESLDENGYNYQFITPTYYPDYLDGNFIPIGQNPDQNTPIGCAIVRDDLSNSPYPEGSVHFFWWYVVVYDPVYRENNPPNVVTMLGDGNNDNTLNVLDVVGMVNFVLSGFDPTGQLNNIYDMNQDSEVNVLDVVTLVNIILDS